MKKIMWKCLSLALAAAFIFPNGWPSASADSKFSIQVDGESIPVSYVNQNERLLVPAVLFSQFGVTVDWNENQQAVLLKEENEQLLMPSGKNVAYYVKSGAEWVEEQLATTILDKQNGTYIPLRYAAEKLGWTVSFHAPTASIKIATNKKAALNKKADLYWLYQITEAEAGGESYQGKLAVAASILNRVKSPDYPNTIKEVIFQVIMKNGVQYYQYSPVKDKRIYKVTPSQDTIRAVNKALKGSDPSLGAVVFYNPDKTKNQWVRSQETKTVIGNHVFAK